jgi:predicted NUDIX family NTP pyrophosphohydrolase
MTVIPYDGDDSWGDAWVIRAKHCLDADVPPTASPGCHWCQFVRDAGELETPRPSGVGPKANPISAGTLLYRGRGGAIEVLLVRALIRGGGAVPWGIPKGAPREGELLIDAARRETAEETGITAPATLVDFGSVTASGHRKTVHCFAGRVGDDVRPVCASHEIDRAEFLTLSEARKRIRHYQKPLLDRLVRLIEPDSAT